MHSFDAFNLNLASLHFGGHALNIFPCLIVAMILDRKYIGKSVLKLKYTYWIDGGLGAAAPKNF